MLDGIRGLSRKFIELRFQAYQRYFLKTHPLDNRFSIILGDRGIGKTTTLIQYLVKYAEGDFLSSKILYVQSDHILMGTLSLYEIAEEFCELGGELIAFDEIHKYSDWSMELKSIADTFPTLKILASGSSGLEIHKGSHDLSRRAIVHHMLGMSFREYLEMKLGLEFQARSLDKILIEHESLAHEVIKKITEKNHKILALFQEYLQWGYYPYYTEYPSPESFAITLEQNIHTTIEADLAAIHPELTGNSIKKIKQLISYISTEVPFVPSWGKIKSIIDVKDNRTLRTYFKYLEDAALIRSLSRTTGKLGEIEQVEKIYLGNTNQLYSFSMTPPKIGTVRETFFLSMLAQKHQVIAPKNGDFKVDNQYVFEIGGKKKGFEQIKDHDKAYLAIDNIELGIDKKIPLWLFGFLY
jgi:predicted AAA+ superfamily ATPase